MKKITIKEERIASLDLDLVYDSIDKFLKSLF